mgnify:CR=1 FL=1
MEDACMRTVPLFLERNVIVMDVHATTTKRTNVHGESTSRWGECQPEADGAAPRHTPSIWARNLKDLRERNNLSQADVAKVLHCSQVAYGMYELGKRKLPVERLIILAKYYHVSLDYLVGLA